MTEKEKNESIDRLVVALDKAYQSPKHLFARGLLLGVASGLGATIGVAIILAVLAYFLKELGGLPVIGDWFSAANKIINQ